MLEDGVHGKVRKSLLFKLSQNGVLKLFQKIILVSSPKDQYVPSYSARVQVCVYVCVLYVCMYVGMHVCVCNVCLYVCMYVCVLYVCMHVCVCMYASSVCM